MKYSPEGLREYSREYSLAEEIVCETEDRAV